MDEHKTWACSLSYGVYVLLFEAASYAAGERSGENNSGQEQDGDAGKDVIVDLGQGEIDANRLGCLGVT